MLLQRRSVAQLTAAVVEMLEVNAGGHRTNPCPAPVDAEEVQQH
jgi:hypothetical protein